MYFSATTNGQKRMKNKVGFFSKQVIKSDKSYRVWLKIDKRKFQLKMNSRCEHYFPTNSNTIKKICQAPMILFSDKHYINSKKSNCNLHKKTKRYNEWHDIWKYWVYHTGKIMEE